MMKAIIGEKVVDITPELLAELFCEMSSESQAKFYNEVGVIGDRWIEVQLQFITEEKGLTLAGRRVMDSIGEYSHWGLSCSLAEEIIG